MLYVGNAKLSMAPQLIGPDFRCRYRIIDIRDISEETLLRSPHRGDHILAMLAKHPDRAKSIRRILKKLPKLKVGRGRPLFKSCFSGWAAQARQFSPRRGETNAYFRRHFDPRSPRAHLPPRPERGFGERLEKGRKEGRQEGELNLLRLQINKRFGTLPGRLDKGLSKLSRAELEAVSLRLFDAKSVAELFGR